MPTTATPYVPPRSKAGWRSWGYSDPSPGQGCPTTTRTQNRCSGLQSTDLITQPAICQQGRGLPMDLVICGLVQRPAPPQRDQVRDASAAPQRSGRRDLSAPGCRLRTGAPAKSTPVVTINALLASTRGGLDQSATLRKRHHCSYVGDGRLSGGRDVIFPDSHRRPRDRAGRRWGQPIQSLVGQTPYLTQGMTGRDAVFCGDVREQGTGAFLLAAHQLRAATPFSRSWLAFSAASFVCVFQFCLGNNFYYLFKG